MKKLGQAWPRICWSNLDGSFVGAPGSEGEQ